MSVEDELKEFINNLGLNSRSKSEKPEKDYICYICNRDIPYFWLIEANNEGRWFPHLCICRVLYHLAGYIAKYIDQDSMALANNCKEVQDEVFKISKKQNANNLFLQQRLGIAECYHKNREGWDSVWYWLFNCKNRKETLELLKEIDDDQPKGDTNVLSDGN